MNHIVAALRIVAAVLVFAPVAAHAFCISGATDTSIVAEAYDANSDRYYSAWSSSRQPWSCDFSVNSIPAPASTLPTGLQWSTKSYAGTCAEYPFPCASSSREVCVFRAEGQVEPASLFLTIDDNECAQLKAPGSGWTYLAPSRNPGGIPSLSAFAVDPATRNCAAGLAPVFRFVNQRWPERGNHRFVADERVRRQMQERAGWKEEGIAFCALAAARAPLSSIEVPPLWPPVPRAQDSKSPCAGGYESPGGCVYTANMAPFDALQVSPRDAEPYRAITGMIDSLNYLTGYSQGLAGDVRSFIQSPYQNHGAGFFVTSVDRISGTSSSIRTITGPPGGPDFARTNRQPFLPGYDADMDLLVTYRLFVKRVRVEAAPGNEAYVQPLVTFVDQRNGKHLLVSPGAIGTPAGDGDIVTRDAATGDVLVYLALHAGGASVGRSSGLPTLIVGKTFDAANAWGYGGDFAWRVNRREFPTILAWARTIDPGFSADPQDYIVEGVGIKGEVVGNAAIGYNLQQMSASVVRP